MLGAFVGEGSFEGVRVDVVVRAWRGNLGGDGEALRAWLRRGQQECLASRVFGARDGGTDLAQLGSAHAGEETRVNRKLHLTTIQSNSNSQPAKKHSTFFLPRTSFPSLQCGPSPRAQHQQQHRRPAQ